MNYKNVAKLCRTQNLKLLRVLLQGSCTVTELVNATKLEQSNVSHHLAELRGLKVVTNYRDTSNHKMRVYEITSDFRKVLMEFLIDIADMESILGALEAKEAV